MDVVEHMATGAAPEELFGLVADLSNYPQWLGLVVRAEPESSEGADEAWMVVSCEPARAVGPVEATAHGSNRTGAFRDR